MKNEIDGDFYCSANCYREGWCIRGSFQSQCKFENKTCGNYHRKHPTPEQYKEEYGKEYPDDGAVYFRVWYHDHWTGWSLYFWGETNIPTGHTVKDSLKVSGEKVQIVCACTPFGRPDRD